MSNIKKCINENCRKEFKENHISYKLGYCGGCGSALKEIIEEDDFGPEIIDETDYDSDFGPEIIDETDYDPEFAPVPSKQEQEENKHLLGDILAIDSLGYIHIVENNNNNLNYKTSLKVFINDKVYKVMPIEYDEFTIGRNSVHFCPDLDLGTIDPEKRVSRKHALVYREDGKFYIRNLSSKNTVHVNELPVMQDENKEIKDQDLIFLSQYIVLKFEQSNI